jgi:hypothetical protein
MTVCLKCKHQPNTCKFLSVLEAQILDTAFSAGEKCRSKTYSILSISGFAFRSTPPSHHHFIIHPVFLFYAHQCEKSCVIIHPSCIFNHSSTVSSIHLCVRHVQCVIYSSRCEWRSVLCYLFYARLIRVSCVVLTPILLSVTCVNLKWICVSCELLGVYLVSCFCVALALFDVC